METKKAFGGKQDGAGRPELGDDKKVRIEFFASPSLHGLLVDKAGNKRGAVSREVVRILELYFREASNDLLEYADESR